ncbi:hypothetical protein ACFYUD_14140 [Nocardia tengchongensis]|uniref:hypothetical protein n=1 Tax=Nocardia tengchongensis TaxID=2055889 RepID=UPI00367E7302
MASTGEPLTIYVPCATVEVRVRLGYQETLTSVEQIVLRAVHAGAATLDELCHCLGINRRLTLDAVQDLWRTGYLHLIKSYAGLEVSREVARRIEARTLDQMESAETLTDVREVMIDKLSGHVMPLAKPFHDNLGTARRNFAVPVINQPTRPGEIPKHELLGAIERGLANEENERNAGTGPADTRRRRALGAYLNNTHPGPTGVRWIPLDIQVATDPDTDQLIVSVVGNRLPERHRYEASRQLTHLVARRPLEPFSQTLRAHAAPGLISAPSIARAIDRLRDQTATAATIPAGRRSDWHGELAANYRQLGGLIDEQAHAEAAARIVTGPAHTDELRRLIEKEARDQLVLVCPWIGYDALNALLPSLRIALKRGVQVVILWGIDYNGKLDDREAGLLYQLALHCGARILGPLTDDAAADGGHTPKRDNNQTGSLIAPWLLVPDSAARTHAKLAIADDHTALVTSWNILSKPVPKAEMGVLISTPEGAPDRGSDSIRAILRWARSTVGYEMSRLMLVAEHDFTRTAVRAGPDDPQHNPTGWAMPRFTPAPEAPGEGQDDNSRAAAQHWSDAWRHVVEHAAREVDMRTHPPVNVVLDAAHQLLLWEALRTARNRLVITSDQLSSRVVDDNLIEALEQALARGVTIDIVYGRADVRDKASATPRSTPEGRLRALLDRHPDRLRLRHSGTHAKALVWDDEAVVTSFNFLSFDGVYKAMAEHRQRSELGLRMSGGVIADQVAAAVGIPLAAARPLSDLAPAALPPDPSADTAQRIHGAVVDGAPVAEAVATQLSASTAPWRVLDRLANHADKEIVRVAAAWCLSSSSSTAPPGRRERWLSWLADDLWAGRRYPEAALVRTAVAGDLRPSLDIMRVAASRDDSRHGDVLTEVWERLATETPPAAAEQWEIERAVVLIAALHHLLFRGDQDADAIVRLEQSGTSHTDKDHALLAGAIRLSTPVLDYCDATSTRPLPVEMIRMELNRRDDLAQQRQLWAELETSIERTAHASLKNTHSNRTVQYLFEHVDGPFTQLRTAVGKRDVAQITEWLHAVAPPQQELGTLIDQASHEVDRHQEPMRGEHRRRTLRYLTTIVTNARAVAESCPDISASPVADISGDNLRSAASTLAMAVSDLLRELLDQADTTAAPEAQLISTMLGSWLLLREWATVLDTRLIANPL